MNSSKTMSFKDIQRFIKNQLLQKISSELSIDKFGIVSEADLQSTAYFHLKQYLKKNARYKIYNKIYLTQYGKSKGIYPDMVILRTRALPRIVLEFKEHSKLIKKHVKNDVKKLYHLRGMDHGYLIYLTREIDNSDVLTGRAREMIPSKYLEKVDPLVINAFDTIPPQKHKEWIKNWNKYSKLRIKKRKRS